MSYYDFRGDEDIRAYAVEKAIDVLREVTSTHGGAANFVVDTATKIEDFIKNGKKDGSDSVGGNPDLLDG